MDFIQMGFYCGLSILYPYGSVYCPTDDCKGDCRGVVMFESKSAPLPVTENLCQAADHSMSGLSKWYQWKPRITPLDHQKYVGERVCFWEDRGEMKNINDLERR